VMARNSESDSQNISSFTKSLIVSVWVLANESSNEFLELKDSIFKNAQKFQSPTFTPHITLASLPITIDIIKVQKVATSLIKYIAEKPIQLDSIRQGDTYYQSVFAHVRDESTIRLQKA